MTNATESLTVTIKGTAYTLSVALLNTISIERNRAVVARQARNARHHVHVVTGLHEHVARELETDRETTALVLAAVRQSPVKGWKPERLELAVRWDRGWKTYEVGGTRHTYYLLRKLAQYEGFQSARLNTPLERDDRWMVPNIITLDTDDITGSDRHGKYRALLDRNNTHYDLTA